MTTFWLSIILLAVTNILHPEGKSKLWAIVLLLVLPLSLYTPLMIYPLLAIAIAGILHPHVRFVAKRTSMWKYILGALGMVVLLAPLVLWLVRDPNSIRELVGIPQVLPGWADLWFNVKIVLKSLLNVGSAVVGTVPQPIFGAASLIIITLGFFKTVMDRHSARSYMLLIWSVLFIPIILLNPGHILIALVPAYLYMAIGVETLIREWYKLFPLNPYARLAGLVPLVILLGGIMISNSAQYFYGYFYGTPNVVYKQQLEETNKIINKSGDEKPVHVVVVTNELPFYDLLRRDHKNVTLHTSLQDKPAGRVIIHDGASFAPTALGTPTQIVTSYTAKQNQVILRYFE